MKTLVELSNKSTQIVMSYEERTTGDKPVVENKFFQVLSYFSVVWLNNPMYNNIFIIIIGAIIYNGYMCAL